jgi:putative NIF3 family GTP cyclohydrolase 1 type 2
MGDWLAEMLPLPSSSYTKSVVHPLPASATVPEGAGYGRRVDLHQEVGLGPIIDAFAKGLGGQRYLTVARPRGVSTVKSFAVCPGSGYDVLKDCDVDLLVTGEMTHHNALKAVMQGRCVITAFHSNSERTFLRDRLRPQLEEVLSGEVPGARVLVSEVDEDPFEIVDVENLVMRGGGP